MSERSDDGSGAGSEEVGSVAEEAGARVINGDRMWHYTEGIRNWDPIWTGHGIRFLPGPSSLWLDAAGKRLFVTGKLWPALFEIALEPRP